MASAENAADSWASDWTSLKRDLVNWKMGQEEILHVKKRKFQVEQRTHQQTQGGGTAWVPRGEEKENVVEASAEKSNKNHQL